MNTSQYRRRYSKYGLEGVKTFLKVWQVFSLSLPLLSLLLPPFVYVFLVFPLTLFVVVIAALIVSLFPVPIPDQDLYEIWCYTFSSVKYGWRKRGREVVESCRRRAAERMSGGWTRMKRTPWMKWKGNEKKTEHIIHAIITQSLFIHPWTYI